MPSPTTSPTVPITVVAFLRGFAERGTLYAGHLRLLRAALTRYAAATTPYRPERVRRAALAEQGPALRARHDELVAEHTRFVAWAEGQVHHVPALGPVLDNLRHGGKWPPAPVPELPADLLAPYAPTIAATNEGRVTGHG